VVGSLATVLLQIFSWFWQWNNYENRLICGKVKAYRKNGANFLGQPVVVNDDWTVEIEKYSFNLRLSYDEVPSVFVVFGWEKRHLTQRHLFTVETWPDWTNEAGKRYTPMNPMSGPHYWLQSLTNCSWRLRYQPS